MVVRWLSGGCLLNVGYLAVFSRRSKNSCMEGSVDTTCMCGDNVWE